MCVLALVGLLDSSVNLLLTVVLTIAVGIEGPLLASMIACVLWIVLSVPRAARLVGWRAWVWWRDGALPPLVVLGPVIVLALVLERAHIEQPAFLLIATAFAIATYAITTFAVAFSREERSRAREQASVLLNRWSLT